MQTSPLEYKISYVPTDDGETATPCLKFDLDGTNFEFYFRYLNGFFYIDIFGADKMDDNDAFSLLWDAGGREEVLDVFGADVVDQVDLFFLDVSLAS